MVLSGEFSGTTATLEVSLKGAEGTTNGQLAVTCDADKFAFEDAKSADEE